MKNTTLIAILFSFLFINFKSEGNNVILNYSSLTSGITYGQDYLGLDGEDYTSLGISFSSDFLTKGVVGVGITNTWIDDLDMNLMKIGLGIGSIYKFNENLHLVANIQFDHYQSNDSGHDIEGWGFVPRLDLRYAFNNKYQIGIFLEYSDLFDVDVNSNSGALSLSIDDGFGYGINQVIALSETLGLGTGILFNENGFDNIYLSIELHY